MQLCDFSRSFLWFVTTRTQNTARIQLDARCELINERRGATA